MRRSPLPCSSLRSLVASALLAWAPGCSYAFVRGPPASPDGAWRAERQTHASANACTTSNVAPVLDTLLAVPFVVAGAVAIVGAVDAGKGCTGACTWNFEFGTPGEWTAVALGALALASVAIASAATGYARTADCRELQEELPDRPHRSTRYLLDVEGIAEARVRLEGASSAR